MKVMAVAHMGQRSKEPTVMERPADLKDLQQYLSSLKGSTVLTFEETSTAQWLFVELYDFVDRIIVCDPLHNRWLCHGPKTDKIDARKLCVLLQGGLLKEVFHSMDALYGLRSLVSSYDDVVRAGVRLLNQRRAMERSKSDTRHHAAFVLEHLDKSIELYRETKEQYAVKFTRFCRRHVSARHLLEVEGIGTIAAVKILATVIDAHRFRNRGHYLAYCGLVRNEKLSGGRSYGCRHPRYSRSLKAVYKTAAMTVIQHGDSPIRKYYEHLLGQGIAEHNARHAIARYIARITYGMLKTGTRYEPYRWRTTLETQRVA
jgi:Arc/MetJ-type ribon-helix-helix transcriptional regulator